MEGMLRGSNTFGDTNGGGKGYALEKVTRKLEETEPGDLVMNNFYLRLFMMYSEKSLKYTNALLA